MSLFTNGLTIAISSMLCSSAMDASQAAALQQAPMHTEAADTDAEGAWSLEGKVGAKSRWNTAFKVWKLSYNWCF